MNIKPKQIVLLGSLTLFIILIIIIYNSSISIPYNINTIGKIIPAKDWIISKGNDGRISTRLVDNYYGTSNNYKVAQFERGDAIEFNLNKKVLENFTINEGDTAGFVYSNEIDREISVLKSDIESQHATINLYKSSEKESIVKEAENKLIYAKKLYEEELKLFERQKGLSERELISKEDFEISLSKVELRKINIEIAKQQLQNLISGEKDELIAFVKTKILSLNREIELLEKRKSDYNLISPISGVLNTTSSTDTLLCISSNTNYLVQLPVLHNEKKFLFDGQKINFEFLENTGKVVGQILRIDDKIHYINEKPVLLVLAKLNDSKSEFSRGMIVNCEINCGDIFLKDFIDRILNMVFI